MGLCAAAWAIPAKQFVDLRTPDHVRLVGQHKLFSEVRHAVGPERPHALLQAVRVPVESLERRVPDAELVALG